MVTIYYKNKQLDKYRTTKSILRYYIKCWLAKEPIQTPCIPLELD